MFADDVRLYLGTLISEINECACLINSDLEAISTWSSHNKFYINHSKSEVMLFGKNVSSIQRPNIIINNNTIGYVAKSKNLGIVFNERLTWDDHVSSICRRVFYALSSLNCTNALIPLQLRRKLVISLIVPVFTYGDVIFSCNDAACNRKLEICFNACLRFIYKRRKFDHLSDVRNKVLGCDLFTYYKYRLGVQLFSILLNKQPRYLFDALEFCRSERTRNLKYMKPNTNYFMNSFTVRSAQLWNHLPNWVKLAATIPEFKRLLASHLKINIPT